MKVMTSRITRMFDGPDALPLGTRAVHLPPAHVVLHPEPGAEHLAHLAHLFTRRTRPELFDIDPDGTDTTVEAWRYIARSNGRLLYDCHRCKVTWPILETDEACPSGHPVVD